MLEAVQLHPAYQITISTRDEHLYGYCLNVMADDLGTSSGVIADAITTLTESPLDRQLDALP